MRQETKKSALSGKRQRAVHQAAVNALLRLVDLAPAKNGRTLQDSARAVLERKVTIAENGQMKKVPFLTALMMTYSASGNFAKQMFVLEMANNRGSFGKEDLQLEMLARIKAGTYVSKVQEVRTFLKECEDELKRRRDASKS